LASYSLCVGDGANASAVRIEFGNLAVSRAHEPVTHPVRIEVSSHNLPRCVDAVTNCSLALSLTSIWSVEEREGAVWIAQEPVI
jgi:hypothetical protein